MPDKRKIFQNIVTLFFSEFANKGIIFFTAIYMLRTIQPAGNGIMAFSSSYFSFFLLFVVFAFNTVGTREIAKNQKLIKEYADTIITTRILLAVVVYAIYAAVLFAMNIAPEKRIVTLIAGVALFANAINLDWVFQGIQNMKVLAVRQVLTSLGTFVGYILFVHSINDLYTAAAISSGSNLVNVFWLFAYYQKKQCKYTFIIEKPLLVKILKSAIPLSIYTFAVTMLNQANVIIMENYHIAAAQVGIFNSCYKIEQFAIIPSAVVQVAFYPVMSCIVDRDERIHVFRKYATLNLLGGFIATCLIFTLPDFVIGIVAGPNYMSAVPILRIYIFSAVLAYINTSVSPVLIAWNQEKRVMYAILVGSTLSIIANFILIKSNGITGAAYATIIGEFSISCCLSVALFQVLHITLLPTIFHTGISAIAAGIFGALMVKYGVHPVVNLFAMTAVFTGTAFLFKTVTISDFKGLIKR